MDRLGSSLPIGQKNGCPDGVGRERYGDDFCSENKRTAHVNNGEDSKDDGENRNEKAQARCHPHPRGGAPANLSRAEKRAEAKLRSVTGVSR